MRYNLILVQYIMGRKDPQRTLDWSMIVSWDSFTTFPVASHADLPLWPKVIEEGCQNWNIYWEDQLASKHQFWLHLHSLHHICIPNGVFLKLNPCKDINAVVSIFHENEDPCCFEQWSHYHPCGVCHLNLGRWIMKLEVVSSKRKVQWHYRRYRQDK